ncbi:alpha/beta fold hydrolase [Amycolatopsis jiangsuensis]|uniref:Pimeloyl-ACP methyl ester carboxylesterase n=1 Tax=Amycolatopsis jiangsuensis TaxID=1181879 RepID=A0A840J579_9PSEU|nr:alpha/beta fold hydrolase [Amycolatopsis jiangsuensis]MBB4689190.1 pimeloyl-ACP methyl ester carboxylesterase [Amycolatopsis jiangsuensis]
MSATAQKGAGPVLVLLHGGGPGVDAASNWAPVFSRFSAGFRCLAPDLLGFGTQIAAAGTEGLRGPRAWARARAQQVLELLDRHELERVHVLGNSAAGGAAALALLAAAPERVERAVLMGGAGTGPPPRAVPFYDEPTRESMRATLGRLVADESAHAGLLDELTDLRLGQALRPGAETAFRSMFTDGTEPVDPATVRTPVLALHGERDRVSPVEVSRRLAGALPEGRLEVVAGAGHWIHVDRPAEFCRLTGEFLNA